MNYRSTHKMKHGILFLPSVLIVMAFACCTNPTTEVSGKKMYFDLPAYLDSQIKLLRADSMVVYKTAMINGKSDEYRLDWLDWKKEFALFYNSDINKVSLENKYVVDSSKDSTGENVIQYAALDSSVRTRSITIKMVGDSIREIRIRNFSKGLLSTSSEDLFYQPLSGYIIKTITDNRLLGGDFFAVMGQIEHKPKTYL